MERKSADVLEKAWSAAWQRERVHYVPPKPEDLPGLMAGMFDAHARMAAGEAHPVVHAAILAFGFVFMHPFEDGNGRIHRFLIHNVLARRDFSPKGLMFPVSAAMLKGPEAYDAALEAFSKPLLLLVDYSLKKRKKHYPQLEDEEILRMEEAVQQGYQQID